MKISRNGLDRGGLTEDEIIDIRIMASTGKFELDQDIKRFIKERDL